MSFYRETEHTAAKPYKCHVTGEAINKGDRYVRVAMSFNGEFSSGIRSLFGHWLWESCWNSIDYRDQGDGMSESHVHDWVIDAYGSAEIARVAFLAEQQPKEDAS